MDPGRRFFQLDGSRLALYNFDQVNLKMGVIFVVKGEIPVMLMGQLGFLACAPAGGEASGTKRGAVYEWNTALALSSRVVVGDNDGPGRELGKKRVLLFGATLVFQPEQFKDLDEWILADPKHALAVLQHWEGMY